MHPLRSHGECVEVVDGNCTCNAGYHGNECRVCATSDAYGPNCECNCIVCGLNGSCTKGVDRRCVCDRGVIGIEYNACPSDHYGSHCQDQCADYDPHGTCTGGPKGNWHAILAITEKHVANAIMQSELWFHLRV